MDVLNRALIEPDLPALTHLALPHPVTGPLRIHAGHITKSAAYCALHEEVIFDYCLIDAKITPLARLNLNDCLVTTTLDGVALGLSRCRVGSLTRPDGSLHRPTGDGITPCPDPTSGHQMALAGSVPSLIVESDIISEAPPTGAPQRGVRLWAGGRLALVRSKVTGWASAAVDLTSTHGPIDDVTLDGCYLAGADYFQVRVRDGGHGRPTHVTIRDVAVQFGRRESGRRDGIHPINTGDDACTRISQTNYVRTEAERHDPTWVVYSGVTDHLGEHLPPVSGWYDPAHDTYSYVF